MSQASQKTVLIRDVEAHWYAEKLGALCPGYRFVPAVDDETALRFAAEAEILVGLAPVLDEALISAATRLEVLQALSTGVDNLLTMPALGDQVALCNCSGFHGPQMSELAFLLMMSLARDAPSLFRNQQNRTWARWPQPLLLHKTVAIVGVGAIAEDLVVRCNAFGMDVIGVSDGRDTVPGFAKIVKRADLASAAEACDFLIVLTPYDASTHHIIDASVLAAMPAHAFLINISRGGCVDEAALIEALETGQIAGAGLDVFATEPLERDDPLWSAPNVLITPHIGGMSDIYKQQALPLVVENLNAFATQGRSGLRRLVKRPDGRAAGGRT